MMSDPAQPKLVVGVGASAGGFDAFKQLLSVLPSVSGMAFLLVQHLDPNHRSLLAELLVPWTKMRVLDAKHGVKLQPNTVYVIKPDTSLAIHDGTIELTTPTLHRGVRLPVDHLFTSLARDYGSRAVGAVLSGAGSDGNAGLRDIRDAGGLTIAQDPSLSSQAGMPQSAIETGAVDLVLSIDEIPAALERFAKVQPDAIADPNESPADHSNRMGEQLDDARIQQLTTLLGAHLSFDLSVYKRATIERRVIRRSTLSGFEDVDSYLDHLRRDRPERQTLVRDLLIGVTDFFRDPEAFKLLRERVIDPLVSGLQPGASLRAWVPACATGEEPYSLAMEMLESIDAHSKRLSLQIFATDINPDALAIARTGVYPASIVQRVSERRLHSYFKPLDGRGYQVRPSLRDVVSFATHDITKDAPFSRMHLVSCRNVLIYLTSEAQRHVLRVLHFALQPEGCLMLSTSESTGAQRDLFSTLSKAQRIYRRLGPSRSISVANALVKRSSERSRDPSRFTEASPPGSPPPSTRGPDLARGAVLAAWVPPTIIVSEYGTILYMHGELGDYLRFPQGESPQLDLTAVLRPELATRIRGAISKCRRLKETVVVFSSPDRQPNRRVRITAKPAFDVGDDAVMVSFECAVQDDPQEADLPEAPAQDVVIDQLEKELQATREDLRSTVEELETSNEELRSSNEESMSMNEELQSTNEELEATTEELRSLNEELTTVNSQLREKVEQLEQAHDDLQNFFSSTKIATLFLDTQLRIKLFTPAAGELLSVDHGDVGRGIAEFVRELLQQGLEEEATTVLENLSASAREVQTKDGLCFSRHVLPYRTEGRRIEGVVVNFVDITALKAATEKLQIRERQQSVVARVGLYALREFDLQRFMTQVVGEVQKTLDTDYCKILELQPGGDALLLRAGIGWNPGLTGSACVSSGSESQAGFTLHTSEPIIVDDLPREKRFSGPQLLTDHGVVSGVSCVIGEGTHPYGVLGAHTRAARSFLPEDANFLQAVAAIVGSAISCNQTRVRLAVELRVAQILSEATEMTHALPDLLDGLALELNASVAEAWWPGEDQQQISRGLLRTAKPNNDDPVDFQIGPRTFVPGDGLVGRVFRDASAIWCTELSEPATFMGTPPITRSGFITGVGLPILAGTDVLGVITFLSAARLFVNDTLLRSLETVGRSIGDFVRHEKTDQRARRLAAITESSHDAILSYDLSGNVTTWLAGAERLFGYTSAEMVGSSVDRIVPEDKVEELRAIYLRIRRGEMVEPFETVRLHKSGKALTVSVRSSPIKDPAGNVIGISSTDRDITRLKETERRLLEADRQKDDFLAMLGHELRNPLAAIRAACDLLKVADRDDLDLGRTQEILERQSSHMTRLLDGLLDVSRIIRGKITLDWRPVDFAEVCREVAADVNDRVRERALNIETEIPSTSAWVLADRVRLVQIIDNLLTNALKYTADDGSITLTLTSHDGRSNLLVKDTGIGIPADLLPHVFEIFRQSEQNLDRAHGGLGLGLTLVKALVELHHGSVEARSEGRGRGSEFSVQLPLTTQEPTVTPRTASAAIDKMRILLIEDNIDSAEMLQQVLDHMGHEVRVAHDGFRGVELAVEFAPEIILCDLGLPNGLTGFDVIRTLRSDSKTRDLRVVAVTGYGRPEDKERCLAAGFDAHLTKPINLDMAESIFRKLHIGEIEEEHGA